MIGCQQERVEIWKGVVMRVDPCDGVGGNLFFSPQLYDRDERTWLDSFLQGDEVFVDVGANLGVYSLWAARKLSPKGTVLAIEADPQTFGVLRRNMTENPSVVCRVLLENTGVSDRKELQRFYRNTTGNLGASSFYDGAAGGDNLTIQVEPLNDVISRNALPRIDFMKIDIEGYELIVLKRFFGECQADLMPHFVLIEMDEGPRGRDTLYRDELLSLFAQHSYRRIREGKNALFQRYSSWGG